ncbi:MAG: phosphocholine cytidylyltransferase family protein [Burkholderiaceae bacterium]
MSSKPVDAIILAAGRGSRMLARTEDRPKCLVEVAGRPILDWSLDALREAGIERVTIVAGYRAQMLAGRADDLIENVGWQGTNMVRSLICAAGLLRRGPVIVSYSDILYHADHVRALRDCDADLALTYDERWLELWEERFEDPTVDAESFTHDRGRLIAIGSRVDDLMRVQGQFMGLLRFTPAGWRQVEAVMQTMPAEVLDRLDMTSLISRLLAADTEVAVVPIRGRWCEVDSESDLALAQAHARDGGWTHDWRRARW